MTPLWNDLRQTYENGKVVTLEVPLRVGGTPLKAWSPRKADGHAGSVDGSTVTMKLILQKNIETGNKRYFIATFIPDSSCYNKRKDMKTPYRFMRDRDYSGYVIISDVEGRYLASYPAPQRRTDGSRHETAFDRRKRRYDGRHRPAVCVYPYPCSGYPQFRFGKRRQRRFRILPVLQFDLRLGSLSERMWDRSNPFLLFGMRIPFGKDASAARSANITRAPASPRKEASTSVTAGNSNARIRDVCFFQFCNGECEELDNIPTAGHSDPKPDQLTAAWNEVNLGIPWACSQMLRNLQAEGKLTIKFGRISKAGTTNLRYNTENRKITGYVMTYDETLFGEASSLGKRMLVFHEIVHVILLDSLKWMNPNKSAKEYDNDHHEKMVKDVNINNWRRKLFPSIYRR